MLYNQEWDKQLTEINNEPWRQVLLDAADLIERKGWCQNQAKSTFLGFTLGYCMIGALDEVLTRSDEPAKVWESVASHRLSLAVNGSIIDWNDDDTRTKKEVVAKLREVANG
jgi:hypothetical protein